VDFSGDDCRVVIIAKVPFPNLVDPQVSARLYSSGGNNWYRMATIRTIVQMTGRGMRSAGDWCRNYVLDKQFNKLWNESRNMIPRWWKDAVCTTSFDPLVDILEAEMENGKATVKQ
jgi:Rad3-related DNA helicase